MRKVALILTIFILVFGLFVGSAIAEEVKVPFSAVKSSCYDQIDMSKSKFLLSKVGRECVDEEWLEENLSQHEPQVATYEILQKEEVPATYDQVVAKRMSYRVVVGKDIEKDQVRPTVEKIVSDIRKEDEEIDSIHLLLYSTEDRIDGAYDIAMAQWAPGGAVGNLTGRIIEKNIRDDYEIALDVRNNLNEYLRRIRDSGEKFGFSVEERKTIDKELVRCEDRAYEQSRKYYDPACSDCPEYTEEEDWLSKKNEKEQELIEDCEKEVREEYGISKEQQEEIISEGSINDWPMPELPPVPDCCKY